jgi:hypothetical protein
LQDKNLTSSELPCRNKVSGAGLDSRFARKIKAMTNQKNVIIAFVLAGVLFLSSFFYSKNEIQSLSSVRSFGFPFPIISISKATDDLREAEKIYHFNNFELLDQGWAIETGSKFSSIDNIFLALLFNFIFYLMVSSLSIGILSILFSVSKQKIGNNTIQ